MYKHTFHYFLGNKKYPEIHILCGSSTVDVVHMQAQMHMQVLGRNS